MDATSEISIFIALVAGLVSFLSPCIFPLIPGYMAYLAGTDLRDASEHRKDIIISTVFFVLGFTVVFTAIGVLLNSVLTNIAYDISVWLSRIGGTIMVVFGLYLAGVLKLNFLARQRSLSVKTKFKSKHVSSFVFGTAFAAGWSPCVGAVLGSIFALSATRPGAATALLVAYSIGLGLPLLLVSVFIARANKFILKFSKWLQPINVAFGVLLIIIGILVFTQNLNRFASLDAVQNLLQ